MTADFMAVEDIYSQYQGQDKPEQILNSLKDDTNFMAALKKNI